LFVEVVQTYMYV